MPTTGYTLLPAIALAAFLLLVIAAIVRPTDSARPWAVPVLASAVFAVWTLYAAVAEGPVVFGQDHDRNAWGNQIWFDLLLALGTAWALLLPRAQKIDMRTGPWAAFLLATSSIGLLAMVGRCPCPKQQALQRAQLH